MQWDQDLCLEFLDLYEKEPILWNPKKDSKRDWMKLNDAWKRIQCNLSTKFDVEELKKKKETLMATYRKLVSKVLKSKALAAFTNDVYKPEWFAFDRMESFLHDVFTPKAYYYSRENMVDSEDNSIELLDDSLTSTTNTADHNKGAPAPPPPPPPALPSTAFVVDNANAPMISAAPVNPVYFVPNHPMYMKRKADDAVQNRTQYTGGHPQNVVNTADHRRFVEIERRMDEAYRYLQQVASKPKGPKDDCDLFIQLLLIKLRALDEDTREIAMHEIDNVMFNLKRSKAGSSSSNMASSSQQYAAPPQQQTYYYQEVTVEDFPSDTSPSYRSADTSTTAPYKASP